LQEEEITLMTDIVEVFVTGDEEGGRKEKEAKK
jgi:hypothetical protein